MEYLNGGSLTDLLHITDNLPFPVVKHLTLQLVHALQLLHNHLDYNPFNNFYGGLDSS